SQYQFERGSRSVNASGCQPWKNIDGRFNFRLDDTMKTKMLVLSIWSALVSFTIVGTAGAADTKIEQALRDLDAQWSAAAGTKDLDKTVSVYCDNAIVMPPNASSAKKREEIQSAWIEMLTRPGAAVSRK